MKCTKAIVLTGSALLLCVTAMTAMPQRAAIGAGMTIQDPSPREIRERIVQILTQMQEQNEFQRNIGFFSQSLYTPRDAGERTNTSSVYYQLPGKRRKNYDWGNLVAVQVDDQRTMFGGSQRRGTSARFEPVMASLLDITVIEPESWITRARALGIDPDKFNEQEWNDKQYYVIGGDPGQLNVPQIWIEKETHRPARAIMFQVRGSDRIFDYRLLGYETFEDGTIFPTGVEMYEGDYRVSRDEWNRFEIDRESDDDFFDPDKVEEELKSGGRAAGVAGGGDDDGDGG